MQVEFTLHKDSKHTAQESEILKLPKAVPALCVLSPSGDSVKANVKDTASSAKIMKTFCTITSIAQRLTLESLQRQTLQSSAERLCRETL